MSRISESFPFPTNVAGSGSERLCTTRATGAAPAESASAASSSRSRSETPGPTPTRTARSRTRGRHVADSGDSDTGRPAPPRPSPLGSVRLGVRSRSVMGVKRDRPPAVRVPEPRGYGNGGPVRPAARGQPLRRRALAGPGGPGEGERKETPEKFPGSAPFPGVGSGVSSETVVPPLAEAKRNIPTKPGLSAASAADGLRESVHGLSQAVVEDRERDPDVPLAPRSVAEAGGHHHAGPVQQEVGELRGGLPVPCRQPHVDRPQGG